MALALAWSRNLTDAHDAGAEGSVTTGNGELMPFVLAGICEDDDQYMTLVDATEAGYAASSASSSSPRSQQRSLSERPVWSEAELDKRLDKIKVQLLDQSRSESGTKINLQGSPLWAAPKAARLVEAMQQATEALVWGERHDASLFDLFCEHRMLAVFVTALRTIIPLQVKVQILQTLSILVQNACRTTSFFFLLSGGQLNILFDNPPDLDEEEILTYFVAFLKSLALRLDAPSARLCLAASVARGPSCQRMPIFECAVKLVGHRDSMVQTAARTALLSLLRVEDPRVQEALSDAAMFQLSPSLSNIVRVAHDAAQLTGSCASPSSRHQDALEDVEDWLGFVGDLIDLGIPKVTEALESYGFTADSQGCGALLASEVAGGSRSATDSDFRGDEELAGDVKETPAVSSRLEVVLRHYDKTYGLPFPCNICCTENVALALTSVASPLLLQREARRAVVAALLTVFQPEELCVDLDTKAGSASLAQLERRLSAALQTGSSRNSVANNVLRSVAKAWHDIYKQASIPVSSTQETPLRGTTAGCKDVAVEHTQVYLPKSMNGDTVLAEEKSGTWRVTPAQSFEALAFRASKQLNDKMDESIRQGVLVEGVDEGDGWVRCQLPKATCKRYHVYTYTLIGEKPYQKLATDSLKKATTSLHYNTLMGRIAIMYDQNTGTSKFDKTKRGTVYIEKAIRMAQTEHPMANT